MIIDEIQVIVHGMNKEKQSEFVGFTLDNKSDGSHKIHAMNMARESGLSEPIIAFDENDPAYSQLASMIKKVAIRFDLYDDEGEIESSTTSVLTTDSIADIIDQAKNVVLVADNFTSKDVIDGSIEYLRDGLESYDLLDTSEDTPELTPG